MRDRLADFWDRASPRERLLLVVGGVVAGAAVGWTLVWQPLEGDLRRLDEARAQARARVATARKAVDEIAGLARVAKPPATEELRAAVERIAALRGLRNAITALDIEGNRIRVTFAAIDVDALAELLEMLGRDEQLFPIEALLAARVAPGSVRAELTLARSAPR